MSEQLGGEALAVELQMRRDREMAVTHVDNVVYFGPERGVLYADFVANRVNHEFAYVMVHKPTQRVVAAAKTLDRDELIRQFEEGMSRTNPTFRRVDYMVRPHTGYWKVVAESGGNPRSGDLNSR